jgi:hypothetical protein
MHQKEILHFKYLDHDSRSITAIQIGGLLTNTFNNGDRNWRIT